jgi:hypothetical protein
MAAPTTAAIGYYESPLAIATLLVAAPLLFLYVSNRQCFPLSQREPFFAVAANVAHVFLVSMFFFDQQYPSIPAWERKLVGSLGIGFTFGAFLIRTWKLYLDTGIANERVKNKMGWFIRHRHWRTPKALFRFALILVLIHVLLAIISLVSESSGNNLPARDNNKSAAYSLLAGAVVVCYFIAFVVFSVLLASKSDGFWIKGELRAVGIGSGFATLMWLLKSLLNLPCSLPACGVMILWVSCIYMLFCSICWPLVMAWKDDPRFSFLPCVKAVQEQEFASVSSTISREYSDFRDSQLDVTIHEPREEKEKVPLSPERLSKLKQVPLHKFLTYPAGRDAFKNFTVREFSVENMLFVEAVKSIRANMEATKADAKELFDQFIGDAAPNQVNLPAAVVQKLQARVQGDAVGEEPRLYFEEALEHVMKLMQRDAYKRFQKTADWESHVVVFEDHSKPLDGAVADLSTPPTPTAASFVDSVPPTPLAQAASAVPLVAVPASEAQARSDDA